MGKSRFIELMAKSMGKSATQEELDELETFLNQFPEQRKMHHVANALKGEVKVTQEFLAKDIDTGLEELWAKIKIAKEAEPVRLEPIKRKSLVWFNWTVAAAVLIAVLAFGFFNTSIRFTDTFFAENIVHKVYVPYGKTREMILPDGTKVKLNAGSTFTYPETFSKTNREVNLKGEGFFEVAKNHKWPFLVHTNSLTIKVLGTIFNVKAYPEDREIETTLLRGKVQVELNDQPEKKIILLPNEKLIVARDLADDGKDQDLKEAKTEYQLKKLPNTKIEDIKETAWLSNKLVFINENFEEVARQLERKYNVQMIFQDPALKTEQLSGVLEKESLESALQIIKLTTPLKFKIEGRIVYLAHK